MSRLFSGQAIAADGDYDFSVDPGKRYAFEVFYPSGVTGTVTPKKLAPDAVTYQAMTWGVDPTSDTDVSIAATGTARGSTFYATSTKARFTLASLSGGSVYIAIYEIPHGR